MTACKNLVAAALIVTLAGSAWSATIPVAVGNHSFEEAGREIITNNWYELPEAGAWIAPHTTGDDYQIRQVYFNGTNYNNGNGFASDADPAPSTNRFQVLTNFLAQSLLPSVAADNLIKLEFYAAYAFDAAPGAETVSINIGGTINADGSITGGTNIASQDVSFDVGNANDWRLVTVSGVVPTTVSGPLNIGFAHISGTNWIDNVSVTLTPVPEPTTLSVLGLGGMTLLSRHRRR